LGGAGERLFSVAQLGQDPGLEERSDERDHAPIRDSRPEPLECGRVRDFVEARLDVCLENPLVGAAREQVDLSDRVMRSASGPEPVRAGLEIGLEDRLEHRLEGGLNHAVADGRYPEAPELVRSAALGDQPFFDRQRPEAPRAKLLTEPVQELLHAHALLDVAGGIPVHASGARPSVRSDPRPRHHQRGRVTDEVMEVVKPPVGIIRCPLVQLALNLEYPSLRHLWHRPQRAGIHRRPPRMTDGRCKPAAPLRPLCCAKKYVALVRDSGRGRRAEWAAGLFAARERNIFRPA
jgi:hypothetical protein